MSDPNDFIDFLQKDDDKKKEMNANAMQKLHRYWILAGLRQSKETLQKDCDYTQNTSYWHRRRSSGRQRQRGW